MFADFCLKNNLTYLLTYLLTYSKEWVIQDCDSVISVFRKTSFQRHDTTFSITSTVLYVVFKRLPATGCD